MTSIDKQRFLAELAKLLTFMYEEDRLRAIELYSRMFDETDDERALLQTLVSPTRQAVVVARAYNANLGRLSLNAESKAAPEDRDENGVPDYVQAIGKVREQAWAAAGAAAPKRAEEPKAEKAEKAEEPETEETGKAEAAEAEEPGAEKAEEPEAEKAGEPQTEEAGEPETEEAGEPETEAAGEPEAAEAGEPEAEKTEEPEAEAPEEPEAEKAEEPEAEKEGKPEPPPAAEPEKEEKGAAIEGVEIFTMPEAGRETPLSESNAALDENSFNIDNDELRKTRKPRVFLLILYILFAIPLTLCAVVVLLIPALLFLVLSVAAIICGVVLVSTIISNIAAMALLSDIMVLLGVALVLFALGLLFLWTAIWFIGGAIVGVVHGVAALCEKWCYKEVVEA